MIVEQKCYDLLNGEYGDDDLLLWYCELVHEAVGYSTVNKMLQCIQGVKYYPDHTFRELLENYYAEQGKDIRDCVFGYLPHKKGFIVCSNQIGNYPEAQILYEGNAKGFIDWARFKGYEVT